MFHESVRPLMIAVLVIATAGCVQTSDEKIDDIYALKGDPTEDNVVSLRGYLEDPDKDVRATALFALASVPVADALELSLDGLQDEEAFVRMTSATLLGDLGDPSGIEPLIRRLGHDEDRNVRQRSAEALTKLGGERAVAALVFGLEDPQKEVRQACVRGVARHDPAAAMDQLLRMVRQDSEWEIRVQAARGLGLAGSEDAREALEAALEDENEFVRSAAAHALRLLDGHVDD